MPLTARLAALHSGLWGLDRWYRVSWYVWPAAMAMLISGWICIDKTGPPSSSAGTWAKPVASTPNFPVQRSPILANWPERLQNDVMTCFSNNLNLPAPQLQLLIDACTHLVESKDVADPQLVNAYIQRGFLQRQSQPDRALADYDSALKIQPNTASALTNRAYIYLTRNRNDDAMADLDKAIEQFPPVQSGYARYLRGFDYFRRKDFAHAMEDLNESIKHIPNSPDPYLTRGEVEQAQKQWDEALRDFDEYSKRAPRNARGLILKSQVLEATGGIAAALTALDAAIAIEPGNQTAITARDQLRAKQAEGAAPPQPKPDGSKD
jgi:tetratricopeptide (TPR) repeat protein